MASLQLRKPRRGWRPLRLQFGDGNIGGIGLLDLQCCAKLKN